MGLEIKGQLISYIGPAGLLLAATYFHVLTILDIALLRRQPFTLLQYSRWRDISFGKLWTTIGPSLTETENATVVPSLVASAHGVVVELGPGSGEQVSRFDKSKVTKVFGIEPNEHLHAALRANVVKAGLEDIYTIVPCGAEDAETIAKTGLREGEVDTVVCVKVLCCVPEPEEMIRWIYGLLKPGGEIIVFEHVRSKWWWPRVLEDVYNLVWPHMVAHCNLNRPTDEWLVKELAWESVELSPLDGEQWHAVIPHVCGSLVKPH